LLVDCVPFDGGRTGTAAYVRGLVAELRRQGHELTLLREPGAEFAEGAGLPALSVPRWTCDRPVASLAWHLWGVPRQVRRRRKDFDGMVLAMANRRVCASYPVPAVAVVHDLADRRVAGKYSRARMFNLRYVLPHFAKKAHRLVSVSTATKEDMVRFWGCREEDVAVLHEGFPKPPENFVRAPGAKNLFYISRIEHPGKNHVRLVEAYGMLPRALAEAHPLVLAGANWGGADAVKAAIAACPNGDCIRFTGWVEPDELEKLWAETAAYVFPSLAEGFGISLAEAMARGIPCACSRGGALEELAGDAAVVFDPADASAIARALERLLGEGAEERAARVRRGLARAETFSWEAHARGIVRLLEECR
jgi:glycosyltransferase involved in cell wall biosynthesis